MTDKTRAFYSYVTNNQKSPVIRIISAGSVSKADIQHGLLLAVSLGLLNMVQVLLIFGADWKDLQQMIQYCPEKYVGRLQQMMWDLEAGVEPKSLIIKSGEVINAK